MSSITHLQFLESEAIYILRETAAQFEKPALLFSGGKDSIVMAWLARKAFYPSRLPFKLLHVDTGHNFPEAMTYRDWFVQEIGAELVVGSVQKSIDDGRVQEEKGHNASRNKLQTVTLLDTIEEHQFDACLGGGRRDEEKARAKERFFSHRNEFGQWDPKNQRPELWNLYNTRLNAGESVRVFPLSNWTELDIWLYILREKIDLVSLYFSAPRKTWISEESGQVFILDDDRMLPFLSPAELDSIAVRPVRCRTLGCYPQTGAVLSDASDVSAIIQELLLSKTSEREGRMLDKDQVGSMEKKKREGYF